MGDGFLKALKVLRPPTRAELGEVVEDDAAEPAEDTIPVCFLREVLYSIQSDRASCCRSPPPTPLEAFCRRSLPHLYDPEAQALAEAAKADPKAKIKTKGKEKVPAAPQEELPPPPFEEAMIDANTESLLRNP